MLNYNKIPQTNEEKHKSEITETKKSSSCPGKRPPSWLLHCRKPYRLMFKQPSSSITVDCVMLSICELLRKTTCSVHIKTRLSACPRLWSHAALHREFTRAPVTHQPFSTPHPPTNRHHLLHLHSLSVPAHPYRPVGSQPPMQEVKRWRGDQPDGLKDEMALHKAGRLN